MKLFLQGLFLTFCLFSIARADDTDEDEFSSSGRQITEACDCTVDGDDTTFLNKSKEMIKMYFQELYNIFQHFQPVLDLNELCQTFTINITDCKGPISMEGCITDKNNPMVSFSHLVKRSCLIESVFSDLMLEKLTSGTSSTGNPNFMPGCTCQKCTQLSSSSSVQSTSITPTTSVSSVTNMTAPPSSSIPSQFGANTDELQNTCKEAQGLSHTSAVIVGVTSFLAGMLAVLLCIWCLYLKRGSKLCFAKPEKMPEKVTSASVTKKVLAKHRLSSKKDTTVTNAVYFKNEKKDTDPVTATNTKMQASEEAFGHINMSKYGGKENDSLCMNKTPDQIDSGSQVYTPLQKTENMPSGTGGSQLTDDEHVYLEPDLDHNVHINNQQEHHNNVTWKGHLSIPGKTDSELFDHTRESIFSNHDYFILQNENFRSSHQPGTDFSQSEFSNTGNQLEPQGDTEHTYFELEKQ